MPANRQGSASASARLIPEVNAALSAAASIDFPLRVWPPDWETTGEIDYFYRSGSVLTRTSDAQRVAEVLSTFEPAEGGAPATRSTRTTHDPMQGVVRFDVPVSESRRTPHVLAELEGRLGSGVVGHDHVYGVTPWVPCPATEPDQVLDPRKRRPADLEAVLWPPLSGTDAGAGVNVSVIDTGLLKGVSDWAPWLAGVTAHNVREDIDPPDTYNVVTRAAKPDGYADPYAGHGSFISGIIRCIAPRTEIVCERMFGASGFVSESKMIEQIEQGLRRSPDIISLSAGGHTRNDIPPVGLQVLWQERLSQQGGVVLVAAAGNYGSARPFWPAAFEWCVGVGSMTQDGQSRSDFSNYGSWVDVYAPGEDTINAYPRMKYRRIEDRKVRNMSAGIARWSGTSFATPIVSALIAARMSRTGENARAAADAVLGAARAQFRPGVGPRLFP